MTIAKLSIYQGRSLRSIPVLAHEMLRFLSDVQATFRGEKHGVVGHWQYSSSQYDGDPVCGAQLWEEFLKTTSDYYLLSNEIRLIEENAKKLLDGIQEPVVLVDFGQGPAQAVRNKTVPIMRQLKNIVAYCPLDTCEDYIYEAGEIIAQERPDLPVHGYHVDYLKDEIKIPKSKSAIGLFFGGTIGNVAGHPHDGLPEDLIISQMHTFKNILGENSSMIMTNDTNQDEASILQSYNHQMQVAFGSNLMHRIKRDLPVYGNFDPTAWHYEPIWHAKNHQLCHTIICDKSQNFLLGNERFNIKAGEKFILNNSFKFPVEKIKLWSEAAGFSVQDHFTDDQSRQAVYLLKAKSFETA